MSQEQTRDQIVIALEEYCGREIIIVPASIQVNEEHERWREWLREVYIWSDTMVEYLSFGDWLIKNCKGREATEDDGVIVLEEA